MKNELKMKQFFNALAFVALAISGLALVISTILGRLNVAQDVVSILKNISYCLAFVVTAISAYRYVKTKRSTAWLVIYILCVIFVVVPLVLGMFVWKV